MTVSFRSRHQNHVEYDSTQGITAELGADFASALGAEKRHGDMSS